jgi:hypothetical protein
MSLFRGEAEHESFNIILNLDPALKISHPNKVHTRKHTLIFNITCERDLSCNKNHVLEANHQMHMILY